MTLKYVNFRWGLTGEWQEMEVANGRVQSRNSVAGPIQAAGDGVVDCSGQYMLPGFIDAHCHILPTGLDLGKLHLGAANSRQEVLQMVRERHAAQPDGWLKAVHYNQTRFADGEHLTRVDLDKISSTRPILLEHVNAHACVVNSAALIEAKVHDNTPDPPGGSYRRDASGLPDGVLLELAYEHVSKSAPTPTVEEMAQAIVKAGEKMADLGISCASDMSTGHFGIEAELQAYALAARLGCPIHMRLYLHWKCVYGSRALEPKRLQELTEAAHAQNTVRLQGIKIFSDGGISSGTAAIYGRYLTSSLAGAATTDGQLIYSPEKLNRMVQTAHEDGKQVSIHAIGDYATDLVLDAFERTDEPTRHRIEHAMILSDAQIERMQHTGCYCTFQPEFLLRLGPAYRRQLGDKRRIASVSEAARFSMPVFVSASTRIAPS